MPRTLNFQNITKPVFDKLVQQFTATIPGMAAPTMLPDGTIGGMIAYGEISVSYKWVPPATDPNQPGNVLLVDVVDKPIFVPFDGFATQFTGVVDAARAEVL